MISLRLMVPAYRDVTEKIAYPLPNYELLKISNKLLI